MARESVLYANEYRHGVPDERDFDRLYSLFNNTADREDDPSASDIMTPLAYEQLGYGESAYEELARAWALYGNPALGEPFRWDDVFGMSLSEAARAALILHGWAVHNGGRLDRNLFDAPHMREVFERAAPRHQLMRMADYLSVDVAGARALYSSAPPVDPRRERFAFNPFTAKPFIDLGSNGVWSPQTMLVSRALFPGSLYYVGAHQWGKAFTDELGLRVERYVGSQLRLSAGEHVEGEITYGDKKSVDWIWVTDHAVVLVECKSARMTLPAKLADKSLETVVDRSIGKGRTQIDETARLIHGRHPQFSHIPADRTVIGMVVTAEPFYLGNASMLPEYGAHGMIPTQVVSLRELENLVCMDEDGAVELLLGVVLDPGRRTWSLSESMKKLGVSAPKNPILAASWRTYDFIDAAGVVQVVEQSG